MKSNSVRRKKESEKIKSKARPLEETLPATNYKSAFVISLIFLVILTLIMLAGVLFSNNDAIISRNRGDICLHYVHLREFGFRELRNGNLALWNPYVFSGTPFLGFFQSALLYPLNWLHLVLPTSRAINIIVALHIFLAGLFMYLWTAHRRLHPAACLLSAILWMFSAPLFMHVYAGHLPLLCVMAWAL